MVAAVAVGSALTDITFQNTTGSAQANIPVTFGQPFSAGAFPASGAAVQLKASDNSVVPCQLDVKVTNSDGSVRHAILSAILPALAANASVTYSIVRAASGPTGAVAVPADFAGLNATAVVTDTGLDASGPITGLTYTADAAALLAASTYLQWLSGPIVSEWIVRAPLKTAAGAEHPDLHARFSIRAYKGQGKAKIDYVIENNWAKAKTTPSGGSPWEDVSIASHVYRVALKAGTTTVMTRGVTGYLYVSLPGATQGTYDANPTGLANDATAYTATVTVDGVAKAISVTGSSAQNFGQLKTILASQMSGAATVETAGVALLFKSVTTGPSSSVSINYGTLFPALSYTTPQRPIYGDEVIHYTRQRWKKTFWWGAAPSIHIIPNKAYLTATNAIPNYDPTLTGSTSEIALRKSELAVNEDIGQNGITKAFMGDVGFARGIGVLPEWTAMYLVNQGIDAKYIMLKMGDLGGSWPIYARDYATDLPINFAQWPYATFSVNVGDSYNAATGLYEKLPVGIGSPTLPGNANVPDAAHHPDLFYVPYLLTGDYYYLEGSIFYNRFIMLAENSASTYRDGRKGLWRRDQVRGQAWSLRTAVHTMYILPDGHALKSDVAYNLSSNLADYIATYVDTSGTLYSPLGTFGGAGIIYWGGIAIAAWQDDYVTAAAGRAVELGFTEWLPLLQYKAKFPVGRLTSGADYCWQLAGTYAISLRATPDGPLFTTFAQAYAGTFLPAIVAAQCGTQAMTDAMAPQEGSRPVLNSMAGYPDQIGGYPSNMQPAVAYAATFDVTNGDNAWTVFAGQSLRPDYNLGPQFAIVPRIQGVVSVSLPTDSYSVTSGQTMYIGRAAPVVVQGFTSTPTFVNTTDGAPWSAQDGKPLIFELHGSSGQNNFNGRQYRVPVAGSMALPIGTNQFTNDNNVYGFSLVATVTSNLGNTATDWAVSLRPIDGAGPEFRQSMHAGYLMADGRVHLTEERRMDSTIAFCDATMTMYNLKKRICTGGSMGGWGSASYGVRRPSKFAAVYPDRPRWRSDTSPNTIAVSNWATASIDSVPRVSAPLLAPEDGGGSYADYMDIIAYVSNPNNKVPWIGWCLGRNDVYASMSDTIAMIDALRATGRGFAVYWNDGDHEGGSQLGEIVRSYPFGTFEIGVGYPRFSEHSADQDPRIDLIGGINNGLAFRNVVESASGWSCEVTSIYGARTVKVNPISDVFKLAVTPKLVTIPAANTWVPVSFTA